MHDNEIIKALKEEIHLVEYVDGFSADNVSLELLKNVLDLITRQKELLEMAEKAMKIANEDADLMRKQYECVKSEAIREFAERLKKKTYPFPCAIGVENAVTVRAINDLVKEMTEGERRAKMAEKEYIEREAVLAYMSEVKATCITNFEYEASAVIAGMIGEIKDDEIPAADVAPVRHGHWIETANTWTHDYYENKLIYKCSLCGRYEKLKEPYCNCGAKMDGE